MSPAFLKKLGAVTLLLFLIWVLYLYRQVPHGRAPFAKTVDGAQQVTLEQGGKKVWLQKQGARWAVRSAAGSFYPADDGRVKSLLSGLKDVQVEDEISDRTDRAGEYEVTRDSGTLVSLHGSKNDTLAEGIFGKQAPDISHIYFRYADKPNVYLAQGLIKGDLGGTEINPWRDRQLIMVPEAKIQAILVTAEGFKSDLVRAGTDTWTLNGRLIDPAPANALVGALAHLRADEFIDSAAYPALTYDSLTYARVNIKGTDTAVELRLGAPDPQAKRYPVSIGKDAGLAWLSESSAHSILQNTPAFPAAKALPNPPGVRGGKEKK